jgi:ribosomal protein S18 acetylase RimI-like enzyme
VAYPVDVGDRLQRPLVSWLPIYFEHETLGCLRIEYFQEERDFFEVKKMLNREIESGDTYPYKSVMNDEAFRAYFLSADAFVLRVKNPEDKSLDVVLGTFYVKPNFPGRSSHICNGGFITESHFRGRGLGRLMGKLFPFVGKALGYRASLFNLVYVSNEASLALWESLLYKPVGRIPDAGLLKGIGFTDAVQFYRDFADISFDELSSLEFF